MNEVYGMTHEFVDIGYYLSLKTKVRQNLLCNTGCVLKKQMVNGIDSEIKEVFE